MHVSPRTLNQAANDAVPILFISAAASAAAVGLYAFAVLFTVALLQVQFEILALVKIALVLGTTVLAVGLISLVCTIRRALRTGV
jgi:hypothetical protein